LLTLFGCKTNYFELKKMKIIICTFAIKHITPTGVGTGTFPIPIDD